MAFEHRQSIGLVGIRNARELGGYPAGDGLSVKKGVFLRTAKLSSGTEEDLGRLRDVYKLAEIIDLRSADEINGSQENSMYSGSTEPDPDPVIEDVKYINLPVLDMRKQLEKSAELYASLNKEELKKMDIVQILTLSIDAGIIGDEMYNDFVFEEAGKKNYSLMFRELLSLDEGRSVLFHCTQGKDRTGIAAMLILSALGVPEDMIVEDYMLTNEFNSELIEKERMMLEKSGRVPPEKQRSYIMALDGVERSTMTNVIARLKERYGSVINYIVKELGISESELEQLREKYLTRE